MLGYQFGVRNIIVSMLEAVYYNYYIVTSFASIAEKMYVLYGGIDSLSFKYFRLFGKK